MHRYRSTCFSPQSDDEVIIWRTATFPPQWVGTDIRWEISDGDETSTVAFRHGTSPTRLRRAGCVRVGPGDGSAQALLRDWGSRTGLCELMKPVDVTTAIDIARPREW